MTFSDTQVAALKEELANSLVHSRKGDRGRDLFYLEGHTVIAQLNRVFGFDGWGYSIDDKGMEEYTEGEVKDWYVLYWAQVTLYVEGSKPRTDIGRQEIRNTFKDGRLNNNVRNVDQRSLGLTACVTDALKRAARTYGKQFGNGLYDPDGDIYSWLLLREQIDEALTADPEAAGKLPKTVEEMTFAEAEKTLTWLQSRASKKSA